jgi:hypothetical protein
MCVTAWALRQQSCELTGTAPFYAVITAPLGSATGGYDLIFPRVTGDIACPVLPGGASGATVTTSATRFAACFTVPADQHTSKEAIAFQQTSGTGRAAVAVFSNTGAPVCGRLIYPASERTMTCTLPDGPLTVLVEADALDATYQPTHNAAVAVP